MLTEQPTTASVTDHFTASELAAALGVSEYSIRHARVSGAFPASWFDVLDRMCGSRGIDCPRSLFNFKTPSSAPSDGAKADEGSLPAVKRLGGVNQFQGEASEVSE